MDVGAGFRGALVLGKRTPPGENMRTDFRRKTWQNSFAAEAADVSEWRDL